MTLQIRSITRALTALGFLICAAAPAAFAQTAISKVTAYAFSFDSLKGEPIRLAAYAGKPVLVVNTASLCGFTPQYAGLQALWKKYEPQGLTVIGVPSNNFGGQEPGGATEIAHTAQDGYGVTFPIAAKADVKGKAAHPFYRWAADEKPLQTPRWNFHKYLIGRDGHIVGSFASDVEPNDPRIINAIERELGS
ncbi:MAG: glutathione peroxidase [Variibacter sp.]